METTTRYRLHGVHHVTGDVDVVLEQGENLLGRDPAAIAAFDTRRSHDAMPWSP